ncbi:hypothetical protein RB213_001639 [Colletotrichum asianum]
MPVKKQLSSNSERLPRQANSQENCLIAPLGLSTLLLTRHAHNANIGDVDGVPCNKLQCQQIVET